MNNSYLIPANSKKSMLYLGLFNKVDLIIFISGCLTTLILMLTNMSRNSFRAVLLVLAPALICSFLVVPIPNQHNVRTMIKNIFDYFTGQKTYLWKGWNTEYGKDSAE